jgi:uncharacterized protein YwqG
MRSSTLLAMMLACVALLAGCSREPPVESGGQRAAKGPGKLPAELGPYRTAIESSRLEFVRVRVEKGLGAKPWSSSFLGRAYRPKGTAWPTDREGKAMALLAQIHFAEVPALAGYPRKGLLQFFVSPGEGRDHIWGMAMYQETPYVAERYFESLMEPAHFRVVYHPEVITDESQLDLAAPPQTDGHLPVVTPAILSFVSDQEYVPPTDYRFEQIVGKQPYRLFESFGEREQQVAQEYFEYAYRPYAAKIGGYGYFVQEDPRTIRPKEDWLVLLEIQSSNEGGVDILWGDSGMGVFLIRRADLESLDFSRVAYYWDNH